MSKALQPLPHSDEWIADLVKSQAIMFKLSDKLEQVMPIVEAAMALDGDTSDALQEAIENYSEWLKKAKENDQ